MYHKEPSYLEVTARSIRQEIEAQRYRCKHEFKGYGKWALNGKIYTMNTCRHCGYQEPEEVKA